MKTLSSMYTLMEGRTAQGYLSPQVSPITCIAEVKLVMFRKTNRVTVWFKYSQFGHTPTTA